MKTTLLITAALAALLFISSPAFAAGGGHELDSSKAAETGGGEGLSFLNYAEGTKKAAEENKLVMIFFWADWCRYCRQIRGEVFSLPRVKEAFDKNYVGVSVDTENDADNISGRFRPTSLPTLAFVRPNGEMLGLLPGAVDADTFIEVLNYVSEEANKQP